MGSKGIVFAENQTLFVTGQGVSKKHTHFAAIIRCFLLNGPLRLKRTRKYLRMEGSSQPECKQEPTKSKGNEAKGGGPTQ